MKNWTGKRVEYFEVLRCIGKGKHGHPIWECKCDCGTVFPVLSYNLTRNTRSCGCKRRKNRQNHGNWRGCGEISGRFWGAIRHGARKRSRNIDFQVTIEYCWDLFLQQNKKCVLTGLPIWFAPTERERNYGKGTASLDRIDSRLGYLPGNVQWLHKDINKMKQDYDESYFVRMCSLVHTHKAGTDDI